MKSLRILRVAGQLLTIVGLAGVAVVAPNPISPEPMADAAPRAKVEICHRTSAIKNPYRRIRISESAINGGHSRHTGGVFDVANPASNSGWGDIYKSNKPPGREQNWTTAGQAIFGINASGVRVSPATFTYNSVTQAACRAMTPLEYFESEMLATASGGGGKTLLQVKDDLQDQGADEDKAVLANLGYSSWDAWYTALPTPKPTTVAAISASLTSAQNSAPTATTAAASAVGNNSAVLNGSVAQNSFGTGLTIYFEFDTVADLANADPTTSVGSTTAGSSSTVTVTQTVTGLTANRTYYFRTFATNADGTVEVRGETLSFTTSNLTSRTLSLASISNYAFDAATKPTAVATPSAGTGAITYTSETTSVCTVDSSSGLVSFVDAGSCTIDASIAADSTYEAKSASSRTFTISAASRTLSLNSYAASYTDADSPPNAVGTPSAGAGTVTYTASPSGVCTIGASTGVVTLLGAGTCTIGASIAANLGYAAATATSVSFTVTSAGLTDRTYTLALSPSASNYAFDVATKPTAAGTASIGVGTKSYSSSTTSVCTIDSSTGAITFVDSGTCTIGSSITADTAGTPKYSAKTASNVTFTIDPVSRTLTLNTYDPSYEDDDTPDPALATPSAGSGTVTYTASPAGVCTINASTRAITLVGAGTCTIGASVAANAGYASASATSRTFTVTTAGGGGGGGGGGPTTTAAPATTAAATSTTRASRRITICHATSSATNPFVQITVDAEGLNGHGDHPGDIIPAPAGGCNERALARATTTTTTRAPRRITICHATGSATNPFVEITVDLEGLNGHGDHPGDIIPAPAEGCNARAVQRALNTTTTERRRVTICHATGSTTNPYVEITVDENGLNGHGFHEDDIIPAPAGGCDGPAIQRARLTPTTTPRRITICHATSSATNPFVEITVDANSLNGHGDHDGDIIPAPAEGCGTRAVNRALVTTTTAPAGSLRDVQKNVNDDRNGGKDKDVKDNIVVDGRKDPTNDRKGDLTISPNKNGPAIQLLDAEPKVPGVKVKVKSSGSNYNQTDTWEKEGFGSMCWKLEPFGDGDYTYTLPNPSSPPDPELAGAPYTAVIVKAGSVVESDPAYQANTVFMSPAAGSTVFADVNKNGISDPGGQGGGLLGDKSISHIIICVGDTEFPEIAVTTTSPTLPPTTTTPGATTTVNPTGPTTTFVPRTTIVDASTTTVAGQAVTTTAPGATTTVAGAPTTTTPGATTTSPGGTTTTVAGATTTTLVGAATTTPGATTTSVPGSTDTPPIIIELEIEPGTPVPPVVPVEVVVSTGTDTERVIVYVNTLVFDVAPLDDVATLDQLPTTGAGRFSGYDRFGWMLLMLGLMMITSSSVLQRRQRRR